MNFSVATDYTTDSGDPEKTLRNISEAGFTYIHWCNQWCTDFLYSKSEIEHIKKCMKEFGLKLLDTHGSTGKEKCWYSTLEYQRQAGVELVKNRVDMTAELGGDAVVMHIPSGIHSMEDTPEVYESLHKSLDELSQYCLSKKIGIAIENMPEDDGTVIRDLFSEYPSDFLGFCYDTGHGNMGNSNGLKLLEEFKDRLMCIHIHDNDGIGDQHKIPFEGTIDWKPFLRILKNSSYTKVLNAEVFNHEKKDDKEFLKESMRSMIKLSKLEA